MSLQSQWREWATPLMRYGVRFIDIGRMGQSERQKYRDGDEEDRASEGESLTSAPALGECRHRSLACRLIAVGGAPPDHRGCGERPQRRHQTQNLTVIEPAIHGEASGPGSDGWQ